MEVTDVINKFKNLSYGEKYALLLQIYWGFRKSITKDKEFAITVEQIKNICNKKATISGNIKQDLAEIFECSLSEISTNVKEAINRNSKYFYGDLSRKSLGIDMCTPHLEETKEKKLMLPEIFFGDLCIYDNYLNKENFSLPRMIIGNTSLEYLEETDDLILPEVIIGLFQVCNLDKANNITLPDVATGPIYFGTTQKNPINELIVPQKLDYDIYFSGQFNENKTPFRPKDFYEIKKRGYARKIIQK